MMHVVPYEARHMRDIELQSGQRGDLPWLDAQHAQFLETQQSFTVLDGDEVLFIGGVMRMWEGRGQAWCFMAQGIGKRFVTLHRLVRKFFDAQDYRRLEAQVYLNFEQAHRWMRLLGFTLEYAPAKAFFPDGSDAAFYARVK